MNAGKNAQNIGVIVGRDLVGDALIKLPFVRAIRSVWPEAKLHWIAATGETAYARQLRDITRDMIDAVHECPDWLPARDGTRTPPTTCPISGDGHLFSHPEKFDVLIDTRGDWRSVLLAKRAVKHDLFVARAGHFLLSDRRPSLFSRRPRHLADRLVELVELASGTKPSTIGKLRAGERELAKARLLLPKGHTYVGIAPGAGNNAKIWPRYKFEKLATSQAAKDRVPVFLLGPQELDWLDVLMSAAPTAKFPLQGYDVWGSAAITVEQTMAIGTLLDVAVANDSGAGHMLAAVDCPLVSLFGPTSPAKLAPRVTHGTVIRAQDFGGTKINSIHWEIVDKAVDELLARARPRAL